MKRKLIIDVGMHIGKDTEFYLEKGFDVVAIEANPALAERARAHFRQPIADGRLVVQNVAIAPYEGEVDFYVNDQHDDWGTISRKCAERNGRFGASSSVIKVRGTTFGKILLETGMPYYLKIDVEGVDTLCLQELLAFTERPKYVSIEAGLTSFEETFNELSLLWQLGYREFKIINQALNSGVRCPNPPLEGDYVDYRFDGLCSGPFGEETPGAWMGIEKTVLAYRRLLLEQRYFGADGRLFKTIFHRLYERLKGEPAGWYDFHAKLGQRSDSQGTIGHPCCGR